MPSAEEEAHMVAELLGCQPLTGPGATKQRVMSALSQAECAHFATHVSWKLAALVLAPNQDVGTGHGANTSSGASGGTEGSVKSSYSIKDDASDAESVCDSPPLQEFLLTAADILDLRLPVKLVVLGSVCLCFKGYTSSFISIYILFYSFINSMVFSLFLL